VAAAVSIREDRTLEDVDISAVEAELIRQDVRIAQACKGTRARATLAAPAAIIS
jgi:hypothetical protein